MRTHKSVACDLSADGIPSCDTGPGGRLVWVYRELRDAWRAHRRRPPSPVDDQKDLEP